ncbi:MAG: hypothetical protein RLZZ09_2077 [Pseudomonadota bacterium]|jgi:hypothetical protein
MPMTQTSSPLDWNSSASGDLSSGAACFCPMYYTEMDAGRGLSVFYNPHWGMLVGLFKKQSDRLAKFGVRSCRS